MSKLSRRQFLLSATATLIVGWLSRCWKEEAELPREPEWHALVDEWHLYSTEWDGKEQRRYLDGVLQKEPIAWWPISLDG